MRHRVILLRVDEVLAADTGEGIDMRLLPMGGRLESLFRYTTYRLISRQIGRTECGRTAAFTLPGGWIVHVAPSAVRDNMIAMELMLFNGAQPDDDHRCPDAQSRHVDHRGPALSAGDVDNSDWRGRA